MKEKPLSPQQSIFAQKIVEGYPQAKAYRIAYSKGSNVKDSTCASNGNKLLKIARVAREIERLRKLIEDDTVMSVKYKRQVLKRIVDTPLGAINEGSPLAQSVMESVDGTIKITKPSIVSAIAEDNKLAGHYPADKLELTGKNGDPVQVQHDITAERMEAVANIIARIRQPKT